MVRKKSGYKQLKGGPIESGSYCPGFNSPDRREKRNHLYMMLRELIKKHNRTMLEYDVYRTIRLIEKKFKEGSL